MNSDVQNAREMPATSDWPTHDPSQQQTFAEADFNKDAQTVLDALGQETPGKIVHGSNLAEAMEVAATPPRMRKKLDAFMSPSPTATAENQNNDAQLHAALDALDTVQQFAAHKLSEGSEQLATTPGQRLAQFLKDQLLFRENARRQAEEEAKAAYQALAAKEAALATAKSQCEDIRKHSNKMSLKVERLEANNGKLAAVNNELRAKLQAAEQKIRDTIRSSDAKITAAEALARERGAQLETAQQRLQQLEMQIHMGSAANSANPKNISKIDEITPTKGIKHQEYRDAAHAHVLPISPMSDIFAGIDGPKDTKNDASSVADSDDLLVDEAAAAVRDTQRITAAKQHQVINAAAAAEEETGDVSGSKATRKKQQLTEERLLRSEIGNLERKCERADHMLLKANHAMRVLHHKLHKERQALVALQEEKCLLQSQLLAAAERHPGIDAEQLGNLLQDLSQSRTRVEALVEERTMLAARLETVENQQTAADVEAAERRQVAESQAARDLEEERARGKALEVRVEELLATLATTSAQAAQLDSVDAALQEAQTRCGQLAAELESERVRLAERNSEIDRLSQIAQAFANELMAAREEAADERTAQEALLHDNAGLQGRVEALTEALERLEQSGGVIESLSEGQADLKARLRQAEAAATGARAAAESARADVEAQTKYAQDLERTVEVLKSELSAGQEHQQQLATAAAAAASQLEQLTHSHEQLQRELELTASTADEARAGIKRLTQELSNTEARATAAENRVLSLESSLSNAGSREDTLVTDVHDLVAALEDSRAEAHALRAAANDLHRELDVARAKGDRLEATIVALNAEKEAFRRADSSQEGTNQALVDSMCDMNGLIDAVAALQHQNRLLQEECDVVGARAAGAEADRDAAVLDKSKVERDLIAERERLGAAQAATEILQHGHDALRGEHAVVSRHLEALEEAHSTLKEEYADLQQRELELRAAVAATTADADRLRAEADRLSTLLKDAHAQAASSQSELQSMLAQKEDWLQCERHLREQAEAADKARGLAEGKLVLAKQKEVRLAQSCQELRQLQADLDQFLEDSKNLRDEKEAAEDRCAELTGRCMMLLDQISGLEEAAVAAEQEMNEYRAVQETLQSQLSAALTHAAYLQEEANVIPQLQARLAELEAERHENAVWCDGMTAQLHERDDDLAATANHLYAVQKRCEELEKEVAAAKERATAAEGAAVQAEEGRLETVAALAAAEEALAAFTHGLDSAKSEHGIAVENFKEAQAAKAAAEQRAEEAESRLDALSAEYEVVKSALQAAKEAQIAVEAALQKRITELETTVAENAAQHAALEEARHHQVTELSTAVHAGSAACTSLAAKVETAVEAKQNAEQECEELLAEVDSLETRAAAAEEKVKAAEALVLQLSAQRDALELSSTEHARASELLEVQCKVLREQVDFMQAAQAKELDLSEGVRQQLEDAYAEHRELRQRLALAMQDIDKQQEEIVKAGQATTVAREQAEAAESAMVLAQKAADLAAADARAAHAARAEAERRVAALEQQLELSELLKDQSARELEVAKETAATAQMETRMAQQAAADAESKRQAAVSESQAAIHDACTRFAAYMAVLDRIEASLALTTDSTLLQQTADELLTALSGDNDDTTPLSANSDISSRRNALLTRLNNVQQGVARLAGERAEAEAVAIAQSLATEERASILEGENAALRAILKLALAVSIDHMGGREDAVAVVAELEPTIAAHFKALESLGLSNAWSCLKRMAEQSIGKNSAEEKARLHALNDELRVQVARAQGAVESERARIERIESRLRSHSERMTELTRSLRWATGDPGLFEASPSPLRDKSQSGGLGTMNDDLGRCVDALESAVQRMLRRYRALSRVMVGKETMEYEEEVEAMGATLKTPHGKGGFGRPDDEIIYDGDECSGETSAAASPGRNRDTIPAYAGTPLKSPTLFG